MKERKFLSLFVCLLMVATVFSVVFPVNVNSEELEDPGLPEEPEIPEEPGENLGFLEEPEDDPGLQEEPEISKEEGKNEWWVEGNGTYFELTNSTYLNVTLTSSENVYVYLESMPKVVSYQVKADCVSITTDIVLTGFETSKTYYRYQDGNLIESFTISEEGSYSYTQDISIHHHVFIQETESTIYIRSDGSIEPETAPISRDGETYTLTDNIIGSIFIQRTGITLDGNDYSITAPGSYGIYASYSPVVTIKNCKVIKFTYGIFMFYSGTSIISGNIIEGSGSRGIHLSNSGACKVIDNTVRNRNHGIQLYMAGNNEISGNIVTSNRYGISLGYLTISNTITGNTVVGNDRGIYLSDSSGGTITSNTVTSCTDIGIYMYKCVSNTIIGNTVTDNINIGVYLYSSRGNTLRNNVIAGSRYNFNVYGNSLADYTNDIDTTNTVDGKLICYWMEHSYETVPLDAGYVGIFNSHHIIVKDLTLQNNYYGVLFVYTTDSTIQNVQIMGSGDDGIYLYYSGRSTITGNTITGSGGEGIYLFYSGTSTITDNTVTGSSDYGIYLYYSSTTTITGNTVTSNGDDGIYLYYSGTGTITSNTITTNTGDGIYLFTSGVSTISGNIITGNNQNGIYIYNCITNTINNNVVTINIDYGIAIYLSDYNTVRGNTVTGNIYSGIYLGLSRESTLRNNVIEGSRYNFGVSGIFLTQFANDIDTTNMVNGKPIIYWVGHSYETVPMYAGFVGIVDSHHITIRDYILTNNIQGLLLAYSTDILIENVQVTDNYNGIDMSYTNDVTISNNDITDNNCMGINLYHSDFSNIIGNTITRNRQGIYPNTCGKNIITGNTISDNSDNGIYCCGSVEFIITNNMITGNIGNGIYLYHSKISTIIGNTVVGNSGSGIYIYYSLTNTITDNTVTSNSGHGIFLSQHKWPYEPSTITCNIVSSNGGSGIYLNQHRISTITDNTVTGNGGYGILLSGSSSNILRNNVMVSNTFNFGVAGSDHGAISQDIDSSNTVDGKPIYYWVGRSYETVPSDAGYVMLLDCSHITVKDLTLANNRHGISVSYSSDCTIQDVNFFNNYYGIVIWDSSGCTVNSNTVSYNSYRGIYLVRSNNNAIFHNSFIDNTGQLYNYQSTNIWDNGVGEGNYWSDYTGLDDGSNNRIPDDGIGDTNLPHRGVDWYPFVPIAKITGPVSGSLFPVGTPVTITGTFTGMPAAIHEAQWELVSGLTFITFPGTVTEIGAGGTVSADYTFTIPGVYKVKLIVSDSVGRLAEATTVDGLIAMVVIYDPSGGFVTGGGWIDSPEGAYAPDPTLTGKASFGFVAKYKKGATEPTGNTEFQFKAGDMNFHSNSYEWLVVAGQRAMFKGTGTINGIGGYKFILTAIDGDIQGGSDVDKFRIKIWIEDEITAEETLIYDNMLGAEDDEELGVTTELGGGQIVIHKR